MISLLAAGVLRAKCSYNVTVYEQAAIALHYVCFLEQYIFDNLIPLLG
ncbi:hypothetical protein [[Limnothrix rosea] IAM M-220]|nr:hypothetical protein [[Limnothrix rosea] IAM M-220]